MQTKTYLLFPEGSCVENTQRFWAGKARLAHEGKSLCVDSLDTTCLHTTPLEIVILAYENWEKDPKIQSATQWAQVHMHSIRVLNPYTWKEIPFAQKVLTRRKSKSTKVASKPKVSLSTFA